MSKKKQKQAVSVEIDKLTNSIVNVISGEVFETEFSRVTIKEINKRDWHFDWGAEVKGKCCL